MTARQAGQSQSACRKDQIDPLAALLSYLECHPPPPLAPASAGGSGEAVDTEEEVEHVLLEIEGCGELHGELRLEVRAAHAAVAFVRGSGTGTRRLVLRLSGLMWCAQGLDTAMPSVICAGRSLVGTWDEDIGSTMVFDRRALEQV